MYIFEYVSRLSERKDTFIIRIICRFDVVMHAELINFRLVRVIATFSLRLGLITDARVVFDEAGSCLAQGRMFGLCRTLLVLSVLCMGTL